MKMNCVKTDQYDSFRCVGGGCPYTCCGGYWKIDVDEESDQRYRALAGDFGAWLNDNLDRAQTPTRMKMDKDGRCKMLTEDGWCAIQRELGEDALCETCRRYPRNLRVFGNLAVMSMTPSCPEVARELLTRHGSLKLVRADFALDNWELAKTEDDVNARFLASVRLLQDDKCGIRQRQRLFLLFNQALHEASGDAAREADVFKQFDIPARRRAIAAEDERCDLVSKIRLLTRLCAPLMEKIHSLQAVELFEKVLRVFLNHQDHPEALGPCLEQMDRGKSAQMMENVLVQYVLRHYYAPDCGENCLEQAAFIVALAQMYRVFCAVAAMQEKAGLPLESRIYILVFLCRGFEHNRGLATQVREILRDEGMLELPFLFRLIS